MGVVCEIGPRVEIAEAKGALTQIVAHAEQVLDLREAALAATLATYALTLGAGDQPAAPPVRRTIGERAEDRAAVPRLLLTGDQAERRVQRVVLRFVSSVVVSGMDRRVMAFGDGLARAGRYLRGRRRASGPGEAPGYGHGTSGSGHLAFRLAMRAANVL